MLGDAMARLCFREVSVFAGLIWCLFQADLIYLRIIIKSGTDECFSEQPASARNRCRIYKLLRFLFASHSFFAIFLFFTVFLSLCLHVLFLSCSASNMLKDVP